MGLGLSVGELKLEEYDYEIVHRPEKGNTNADMSRNPIADASPIHNFQEKQESPRKYSEEERQILYEYHNSPIGGHQGVTRTLNS